MRRFACVVLFAFVDDLARTVHSCVVDRRRLYNTFGTVISPAFREGPDVFTILRSGAPAEKKDWIVITAGVKTSGAQAVDAADTAKNYSTAQLSNLQGVDATSLAALLQRTQVLVELHVCLPEGTYTHASIRAEGISSCEVRVLPATDSRPVTVQCFIDRTSLSALFPDEAKSNRGHFPPSVLDWLKQARFIQALPVNP